MSLVETLSGRILDADSHEMYPASLWTEVFGGIAGPFADFLTQTQDPDAPNSLASDVVRDEAPIGADTLEAAWTSGSKAPGAFDMSRRLDFMDLVGIDRQLIFAGGLGALGTMCLTTTPETTQRLIALFGGAPIEGLLDSDMMRALGTELLKAWNEWCVETSKISPRLRPVALVDTSDIAQAAADAERLISAGIRAIGLASGVAPGGKSPGSREVDPLWEVFAANDVPVLFHCGGDLGLLSNPVWGDYGATNRIGQSMETPELTLDAYQYAQMNIGVQNFLTPMIYGAVFDRHPDLHVGCIEVGSHWVGPTAENLTYVGRQFPKTKMDLTPAEYMQRNVRATSFYWEPVDKYIDRYGLEDVYVFGSDYPHFEGGKDPVNGFGAMLERLGPTVAEKVFVTNANLLLPA